MKEFFFAVQFLLSQEIYYTEGGKVTTDINGRMSYTDDTLYLEINDQLMEYHVDAITPTNGGWLVLFSEEGIYGAVSVGTTIVWFDILTGDPPTHIRVKYKVKITNL